MQKKNIRNIFTVVIMAQFVVVVISMFMMFAKAARESKTNDEQNNAQAVAELTEEEVTTPSATSTPLPTSTPTVTPTATPTPFTMVTPISASYIAESDSTEFDLDVLSAPMPKPTSTPTPAYTPARTLASSSLAVETSGRYVVYGLVTDQEIRDMAALVYLEAGAQSYKCQMAIASVIVNLMMKHHATVNATIFNSRTFSPARRISYTNPSQSCLNAVRDVLANGTIFPSNVTAFRNRHYHNFGTPYCVIDGVYFSTN